MFESFLLIGCIVFFIILVYAFQMRQRMYNSYPTACKVTYYPKKEEILMMPEQSSPSSSPSSPPSPSSPFIPDETYRIYDPETIQGFG